MATLSAMPSRTELKLWRSLRRRKGRETHGLFLVEGPRIVTGLLRSSWPVEAVLYTRPARDDPEVERTLARCEEAGLSPRPLEPSEFARLAETVTPRGVLAVAAIPAWGWADVRLPRLLLLDGVQDPGNVGTLIRTAEALGLGGVILLPGTADAWSPKVTRAAAGSTLRLPTIRADRPETRAALEERRIELWTAEVGGDTFDRGARAPERLALALGSESHGVSEELGRSAARRIAIPMAGSVQSLNVSVAGAMLMDRIFGVAETGGGREAPA